MSLNIATVISISIPIVVVNVTPAHHDMQELGVIGPASASACEYSPPNYFTAAGTGPSAAYRLTSPARLVHASETRRDQWRASHPHGAFQGADSPCTSARTIVPSLFRDALPPFVTSRRYRAPVTPLTVAGHQFPSSSLIVGALRRPLHSLYLS